MLPAAEGAWDVWLLSKQGRLQCWGAGAMPEDVRLLEAEHERLLQGNAGLQVRQCCTLLGWASLMMHRLPVLSRGPLKQAAVGLPVTDPCRRGTALLVFEPPSS